MAAFTLTLTPADALPGEMTNLYWDLRDLARAYRPRDRDTNSRVLDEVLPAVSRGDPVAAWPGVVCQRFAISACALAREALLLGGASGPGPAGLLEPRDRAAL